MAIAFGVFAILCAIGSFIDADSKNNVAAYQMTAAVVFAVGAVAYGSLVH